MNIAKRHLALVQRQVRIHFRYDFEQQIMKMTGAGNCSLKDPDCPWCRLIQGKVCFIVFFGTLSVYTDRTVYNINCISNTTVKRHFIDKNRSSNFSKSRFSRTDIINNWGFHFCWDRWKCKNFGIQWSFLCGSKRQGSSEVCK